MTSASRQADMVELAPVTLVRSSNGDWLLHNGHRAAPCGECLAARVTRSGVSILAVETGAVDLPSNLARVLAEQRHDGAPAATAVRVAPDGRATRHVLLAVPGCAVCGRQQVAPCGAGRIDESVLLDPELGVVTELEVDEPRESERGIPFCYVYSGGVSVPGGEGDVFAGGAGLTAEEAGRRLLGEAVERYAAMNANPLRLIETTGRELGLVPAYLGALCRFHSKQLVGTPFVQLSPDVPLAWMRGESLKHGKSSPVPAAYVYLTRRLFSHEPPIDRMFSTGLASHRSIEEARTVAVLEVLERYAMTAAWHRQDFGMRVPCELLPEVGQDLVLRLRDDELRLIITALTSPPDAPVLLAAVVGSAFPYIAIGSAAALEFGRAAVKAILEAVARWHSLTLLPGEMRAGDPSAIDGEPTDHVLWHATPPRAERLTRCLEGVSDARAVGDYGTTPARAIGELCRVAYDVVEVNLTPADCAWCGFEVVRIVAPGVPLFSFGRLSAPGASLTRCGLPLHAEPHPYG